MKLRNKFARRNFIFNVAAVVTASSIAAYSFAAPDYDRIKKDVNIMIGIVKSSINDAADCRRCKVRITGHYLADQGAVFNVTPSGGYAHFGYNYVAPNADSVVINGVPVVPEIPEMVYDILSDVQVSIDSASEDSYEWDWNWDSDHEWHEHNREAREELREFRSELRELARERREVEIESIHAEEEELAELEAREQEIEQRFQKAEQRREQAQQKYEAIVEKRNEQREAKRVKRVQEREKQFVKMESIVLNTFCDYSSTMRSLPDDERISIIINKGDEKSNVYVFRQSDLSSCDSAKSDVRADALSYVF